VIDQLRHQVGQLFVVGLEGPTLTPIEHAWLAMLRPGGVILFRRNIESPKQTAALVREIAPLAPAPLLRAIDVEGGLVDRLRDAIAPIPSASAARPVAATTAAPSS
jgi:beta-N-acetylhexosaminidase